MDSRQHHHLIVQAWIAKPIKDSNEGATWLMSLIEQIDMKLLAPIQSQYCSDEGNRGLTVAALITTSHVVLHLWDEDSPAELQLDVYSCKEYEKNKILLAIKKQFNPLRLYYKYIDRRSGLKLYDEDAH